MRRSELQAKDFKVASKEIGILRLRYLRAFIKQMNPALNMTAWCGKSEGFKTNGVPECGTPFCFGGWILALFAPPDTVVYGSCAYNPEGEWLNAAITSAALIGIDYHYTNHNYYSIRILFESDHVYHNDPKDEALARLEGALRIVRRSEDS